MRYSRRNALLFLLAVTAAPFPTSAWDAHGHRTITLLALDGLPSRIVANSAELAPGATPPDAAAAPVLPPVLAFLVTPEHRHMVAWQSAEPDRWRGTNSPFLSHENSPDHYLDVDLLEQFGLTLQTIPPLRYEYVRAMVIAKHEHPENITHPYNERTDPARTQEFPGYLPHAIMEHHAKLTSSLKTLRILEHLNDPARAPQRDIARANVMVSMGILSHFVGDAAQPLHTTKHFNGWVGDNPDNFTTDKKFHQYIDGDVLAHHAITYHTLAPQATFTSVIDIGSPWTSTLEYIERSYARMRPLYELEKSGDLQREPGKQFINVCLLEAGSMLAEHYATAWRLSEPTEKDITDFIKYDVFDPATVK